MVPLLSVENLQVRFRQPHGDIHVVNGLSFRVYPGECLGILGESGSGKSVSLMAMLGLFGRGEQISVQGHAWFAGQDLLHLSPRDLRAIRGRAIGYVAQSLVTGLSPYARVGRQIMEPLLAHHIGSKAEARLRALSLMEEMGIPHAAQRFRAYPFELSGGMQQRIMIAVALACEPSLLVADEPTTALDATTQTQVLSVLKDACSRRNMTVIMITHDLAVAANVCDRLAVLYGGRLMELATTDRLLQRPMHPYTKALRRAVPSRVGEPIPLTPIPGHPFVASRALAGCPFVARCTDAIARCHTEVPALQDIADDHAVACHVVQGVAEHV